MKSVLKECNVFLSLLSTIFILSMNIVCAQKFGHVWHFGNHAGIDFKSCTPEAISNSSMDGFEGCASICDTNGNILFYTIQT